MREDIDNTSVHHYFDRRGRSVCACTQSLCYSLPTPALLSGRSFHTLSHISLWLTSEAFPQVHCPLVVSDGIWWVDDDVVSIFLSATLSAATDVHVPASVSTYVSLHITTSDLTALKGRANIAKLISESPAPVFQSLEASG